MTTFSFESTGDEVVEAFRDQIRDRIIVITGPSHGGIGGATAIYLAAGAPKRLILISRDISKIQPVIATIINTKCLATQVSFVQCDLSSQKSVRKAVAETTPLAPHIDVLIDNAAIPPGSFSKTEDGIESQFAVNHLGHFLLINLLMPRILATKPSARIVNVSSSSHRHRTHVRFDDYNFSDGATYSEWDGYIQSKLANVVFSSSLAQTLERHQILSFSLHSGSIASGMQGHVPEEAMAVALKQRREAAARDGRELRRAPRNSIEQGCVSTLVAALDPSIAEQSGTYPDDGRVVMYAPLPDAANIEDAEKLWKISEELAGQRFDWA